MHRLHGEGEITDTEQPRIVNIGEAYRKYREGKCGAHARARAMECHHPSIITIIIIIIIEEQHAASLQEQMQRHRNSCSDLRCVRDVM